MTRATHKLWLKFAAIVVGSFGPVFFLGSMAATSEPARWTLDLIAFPPDGATHWDAPELRLLSALAGGFLVCWGVLIWCLQAWVYDAAPEGVRRAVLAGLLAWCVLDSAGSVAAGAPMNAVFNTALLLVAVGPLWRPAREDAPVTVV